MVKLTKQEIEQRVKKLFKGLLTIDWEGKDYQGRKSKVKVLDPLYGPFYITVNKLLSGQQHKARTRRFQTKESVDDFVKKEFKGLVTVNWDKTPWPLAVKDYVYVVDVDYGEWKTKLSGLIQGNGHRRRYDMSKSFGPDGVEQKIKKIFKGLVTIDWNGVHYNGRRQTKDQIIAIDRDYGPWKTTVSNLLRGTGHPQRSKDEFLEKKTMTRKEIDSKVRKIHKGKVKIRWDLVKNYKHQNTKIIAEDRVYGLWQTTAGRLLQGQEHKLRSLKKQKLNKTGINKKVKLLFENKVYIN